MFVSILQRLGLKGARRGGEPLQSRADQNTRTAESGGEQGRKPLEAGSRFHAQAASDKKQTVKAPAKNSKVPAVTNSAKAKTTSVAAPKAVQPVVKAKAGSGPAALLKTGATPAKAKPDS
ncbi:MAG: RNA polymerase-binding protein DksA, partial [Pseudomonadota bacterium]